MTGKIGSCIEAASALMIHKDEHRVFGPMTHDFLNQFLTKNQRPCNMNSLKLLTGSNIQQTSPGILDRKRRIGWGYKNTFILLMSLENLGNGILWIDPVIPCTNALESFIRLKSTTRTAPNVVMPEKRPLSARTNLQELMHCDRR